MAPTPSSTAPRRSAAPPKDLVVRVGGREVPEKGSTLHVVPRSGETHVFSTSTGARLSD
ncbi:hypothetical protein GCM10020256_42050 [Streptomyces thermocoprophilus]